MVEKKELIPYHKGMVKQIEFLVNILIKEKVPTYVKNKGMTRYTVLTMEQSRRYRIALWSNACL